MKDVVQMVSEMGPKKPASDEDINPKSETKHSAKVWKSFTGVNDRIFSGFDKVPPQYVRVRSR